MNIVNYFTSIHDMHKYLTENDTQPYFANRVETGSHLAGSTSKGTESYEQADNFLLYGDKESMKKVEEMGLKETRENIARYANRRQVYSSVVGFAPNVANYVAGSPCSMIASRQVRQKQKTIKVCYINNASGYESTDNIFKAAVNMFCAIMILEAQGISVDLTIGICAKQNRGKDKLGMFLKIKRAGQKLDILRMIYPCVNPSFLRRHYFRYTEVTKGVIKSFVNNYGYIVEDKNDIRDMAASCNIKPDVIIRYYDSVYKNVDDVLKMIRDGK